MAEILNREAVEAVLADSILRTSDVNEPYVYSANHMQDFPAGAGSLINLPITTIRDFSATPNVGRHVFGRRVESPDSAIGDQSESSHSSVVDINIYLDEIYNKEYEIYAAFGQRIYARSDDKILSHSGIFSVALINNWERLRKSNLSEQAFNYFIQASTFSIASDDREPLSGGSLALFLRFWELRNGQWLEPDFGVTLDGVLQGLWEKDENDSLAIEFGDDGELMFSLWCGSSPIEGVVPESGFEDFVAMLEVRSSNPLSWG